MSLNAARKKLISQQSKENFEKIITYLKLRLGDLNYIETAQYISEKTGYLVDKDSLWRTAAGNYAGSPAYIVMLALSRLDEISFLPEDNALEKGQQAFGRRPTLDELYGVLLGEIDAYGQPIEQTIKNPAD